MKGSDSLDILELAEEEALDCSSCCIILKYCSSVFVAVRRALAWDFWARKLDWEGRLPRTPCFWSQPSGNFLWNSIRIPPFYFKFSLENYNAIIEWIVKVPLENPRNEEFCAIKAEGRKLFLKVRRFVIFFQEFKTITKFEREDVTDRAKIIPPSSEPCRNLKMLVWSLRKNNQEWDL